MSEADYNVMVGKFVEKNYDRLVRTSTFHAKKIYGRDDYRDNAHEILSAFVMHLYNNQERVLEVKEQGWLEQFSTMWIARNAMRVYENVIKSEHVLIGRDEDRGDGNWERTDRRSWEAHRTHKLAHDANVLEQIYLDAEDAPHIAKEYILDLYSAGYEQPVIDKILLSHLAASESLEPHERIMFRMYFVEGKSYRELQKRLNIDKSACFRMVKQIEEKIKKRIEEYGTT
jgi:hypothetical protein